MWSALVLLAIVPVRCRGLLAAVRHFLRGWVPQLLQRSSLCDAGAEFLGKPLVEKPKPKNSWLGLLGYIIINIYIYNYKYIIYIYLYCLLYILLFFGHSSDSTTSCTSSERVCAGNSWGWEVRDQTLRLQVTGPPSTVHGDDLQWSISMAVAMCGVWLHIHVSSCLHPSFSFLTFLWSLAN